MILLLAVLVYAAVGWGAGSMIFVSGNSALSSIMSGVLWPYLLLRNVGYVIAKLGQIR